MAFSPFAKPPGAVLTSEDLGTLVSQSATEGYHIEFKRQLPIATKIAKSVASFANTYGGWYVVGVTTTEHNVAQSVTGFDAAHTPDPASVIRDAIRNGIDPSPIFNTQIVDLGSQMLVAVVYVPDGQPGPFITRDGRIYRRTGDSSEPVPENSRQAVDQIVERGRRARKRFTEFANDRRAFSKLNTEHWVRIFAEPVPFGTIDLYELQRDEKRLLQLLKDSKASVPLFPKSVDEKAITGGVPYTVVHMAGDTIVLNQRPAGAEGRKALTLEIDVTGRARFLIPFNANQLVLNSLDSVTAESVKSILEDLCIKSPSWERPALYLADVGQVLWAFAPMFSFYQSVLGGNVGIEAFRYVVEIEDLNQCIPFADFDGWAQLVADLGLPIVHMNRVRSPSERDNSWACANQIGGWVPIVADVLQAFGLPASFLPTIMMNVYGKVVTVPPAT